VARRLLDDDIFSATVRRAARDAVAYYDVPAARVRLADAVAVIRDRHGSRLREEA